MRPRIRWALTVPKHEGRYPGCVSTWPRVGGTVVFGVDMGLEFDYENLFGDDYLHFYLPALTEERSRTEADAIIRLVGLEPGMRVLDIPCGHGRISNLLAAFGCEVIGVDRNERFLELARRGGTSAEYVQADMREYLPDRSVDVILNWYTSFGFFDDASNRDLLAKWRAGLSSGGRLLMELQNRQRVLGLILAGGGVSNYVSENGEDLMLDRTTFDPLSGRMGTERTSIREGRARTYRFSLRTFAYTELRQWLLDAGFNHIDGYGADGELLTLGSRRMVVVAKV